MSIYMYVVHVYNAYTISRPLPFTRKTCSLFNHKIWANSDIRTFALPKSGGGATNPLVTPPPPFFERGTCPPPPPFPAFSYALAFVCLATEGTNSRCFIRKAQAFMPTLINRPTTLLSLAAMASHCPAIAWIMKPRAKSEVRAESNTLQGFVKPVMDSENQVWNAVLTYIQYLNISSYNWIYETSLKFCESFRFFLPVFIEKFNKKKHRKIVLSACEESTQNALR